jgi:hypothetical protein
MAEPVLPDKTITVKEFGKLTGSFARDLKSLYSLLNDEINNTIAQAEREGWDDSKLVEEIERLMD